MFAEASSDGLTVQSSDGTSEELQAELQPVAGNEKPDDASVDASDTAEVQQPAAAKAKARNNPIARMEEATGQAAAAKREADTIRRENADLRARLDALERPKTEAPKPEAKQAEWKRYRALPDAPKLADFDGDEALEDWNAATALFIADKRYEERRAIETQSQAKTAYEAREMEHYRGFEAKLNAAGKDFIESIDPVLTETHRLSMLAPGERPTFGNWLVEQIYRAEPVKELLVYFNDDLANGKKEAQRLAALPPDLALREFARLEARLTPAAAPLVSGPAPTVKSSTAKPPIRPERGSAQVGSDEPPGEDATEAEHEAYWGPRRAKLRHA